LSRICTIFLEDRGVIISMNNDLIAHVRQKDDSTWASPHKLSAHLEGTARLAELYSRKFKSGEWGKSLGLAHDAGKGRIVWQKYLELKSGYDAEAHLEGKIVCPERLMV